MLDARIPRHRDRAIDSTVRSLSPLFLSSSLANFFPATRIDGRTIVSTNQLVVMLQEKVKGLIPTPFTARRLDDDVVGSLTPIGDETII